MTGLGSKLKSTRASVVPSRRNTPLAGRAGQPGRADEGEEPPLEVAVAARVDEQLVQEDDAAPAAAP